MENGSENETENEISVSFSFSNLKSGCSGISEPDSESTLVVLGLQSNISCLSIARLRI